MLPPVTDKPVSDGAASDDAAPRDVVRTAEVVIIGAGFSGMGAAIKLLQKGIRDLVILDRGRDVGGTWRDNTYPGAACDVPSQLYSFSFAPNKQWSRSFSTQPEIERYLQRVAREYKLADYLVGECSAERIEWHPDVQRWYVHTTRGLYIGRFVVGAIGPLCEPNLPDIPGIDSFEGEIFHSARWNHDTPLDGKRVALIGTGASAIQIGPKVAPNVDRLDIYQRTAPWIEPRFDRPYTPVERLIYRRVPGATKIARLGVYLSRETQAVGMTRRPVALRGLELLSKAFIRTQISDRKLRKAVTPNYRLGCKRILISNTWYRTLGRPNVDLVTDGIAEVRPHAIVTTDGTVREVDAIIVATGFHVTDSPVFGSIIGSDGRSLADVFDEHGMQGYKGTTVHGFPNLFLMIGPNTGLGHTSMVYMIESQLNYLTDAMVTARRYGLTRVEVTAEAQRTYNAELQERMKRTVWVNGGCSSWYQDKHGNVTTTWPDFTFEFRRITRTFDPEAYTVDGSADMPGTGPDSTPSDSTPSAPTPSGPTSSGRVAPKTHPADPTTTMEVAR